MNWDHRRQSLRHFVLERDRTQAHQDNAQRHATTWLILVSQWMAALWRCCPPHEAAQASEDIVEHMPREFQCKAYELFDVAAAMHSVQSAPIPQELKDAASIIADMFARIKANGPFTNHELTDAEVHDMISNARRLMSECRPWVIEL